MISKSFTYLFVLTTILFFAKDAAFAGKGQLSFIENKGQWGHGIRYKAEIPGGVFFLTDKGFTYNFINENDYKVFNDAFEDGKEIKPNGIHFHAYNVNFVGGNSAAEMVSKGFEKRSYYYNYFIDNDPSKWAGHVNLFGKVKVGNIYNGIDLYVYNASEEKNKSLKYDFIVGTGINPHKIQLSFEGVNPTLTSKGNLVIKTTVNKIVEQAPYCYQEINGEQVSVASKYVLENGHLSFSFPEGYNKSYPLVIDPNLVFATYSGGVSSTYYAHCTTYDNDGNTYAAPLAMGSGWPTSTGAYQASYPGQPCTAINKYSSDGSQLLYSTYLGASSGYVEPNTLRVNKSGELVIAGSTTASTFPVTTGAYQTTFGGGNDIYVSKLSADGTTLLASTFVGGSGFDASLIGASTSYTNLGSSANPRNPVEVAFQENGDVWVVSNSSSNNFPVTSNAFQATKSGVTDAVVLSLDSNLTTLNYSTYLGGNGWDGAIASEFDPDGNLVVAGMTSSTDFPTTSGVLHPNSLGGEDGFVARFDPTSGAVINATYIGTSGIDDAERLDFDCSGNVFVAGRSLSGVYPVSSGAWSNPNGHIYVQKLTPDLTTSIASTTVGTSSSTNIVASAFMVDQCGQVVIGMVTSAAPQSGLELSNDAFQTNPSPFYLAVISPLFDELEFGSYLGVSIDHYHPGVSRLDKAGAFYQSVCSTNGGWPTTPNSYSPTKQNGGTNDIVTFKFDFDVVSIGLEESTGGGGDENVPHCIRGCKSAYFNFFRRHADSIPLTIHYVISGNAQRGLDYVNIPDSITIPAYDTSATLEIKPLIVPGMPTGPKEVTISVLSPCGCDGGNNSVIKIGTIRILDSLYVKILTPPDTVCANTPITIQADIDSTLRYQWMPDQMIPDARPLGLTIHPVPLLPTTYSITVSQPGAPSTCPPHTVDYTAMVEQYPQVIMPSKDTTVCIQDGDSIDLTAYALPEGVNYIYDWSPTTNLRDASSRINKFSAPPGDYSLNLKVTSPWAHCEGENDMVIHVVPPFHFTSITPADTLINYGDSVTLDAQGDAIAWIWLPVYNLNEPTFQSPIAWPRKSTHYKVIGIDKYGCRDTGYANIAVKYVPNFFVPSAFTPNGDGVNDIFRIGNLREEKLLTFKIFNRLGQLVFSTNNIINGWDGTLSGKPAPADTYYYMIELVLPGGEHQTFKGDVTLVR